MLALLLSCISFDYFFSEPFTRSTSPVRISLTSSSSPHSHRWSPGSAPFAAASRKSFVKLATNSKSKWRNEPSRPAC